MRDTKATVDHNVLRFVSDSTSPDDERWQLAQRIVASKSFAKSSFLTKFLLYVCDREIRGRPDEITEYQIGIQAFGRPADYNPGDDNIVRNYARLLRKRLEEYFETEGRDETIRVFMPRGRYIPVFSSTAESHPTTLPILLSSETPLISAPEGQGILPPTAPPSSYRILSVSLIPLAIVLAMVATYLGSRSFKRSPRTLSDQFWTTIFSRDRPTLVVPADSGFGIVQNLTGRSVHLGDYVNGSYLAKVDQTPSAKALPPSKLDTRNLNDLSTQRYTSMVDLNIALSLSKLPQLVPDRFLVRYARDVRMEDLKHSNAILLGSLHSNPWVELFQKNMNFAFEYRPSVDDSVVINRRPLAGETQTYRNAWDEDSHRTYTVLAFVPSLDGAGRVLLLEGLNMAGTQAAADFLINPETMNSVLRKARQTDGTFQSFELLLETSSIGGNAPEARVIAERYASGQTSLQQQ
jgi:hypothetical protein